MKREVEFEEYRGLWRIKGTNMLFTDEEIEELTTGYLNCNFIVLKSDSCRLVEGKIYEVEDGYFKAEDGRVFPLGRSLKNKEELIGYLRSAFTFGTVEVEIIDR